VRCFSLKRKYAVDVLRYFGMMNCKSMTTQMISNLKKLQDQVTGSEPEDPTDISADHWVMGH
jgi:hypothetical protein